MRQCPEMQEVGIDGQKNRGIMAAQGAGKWPKFTFDRPARLLRANQGLFQEVLLNAYRAMSWHTAAHPDPDVVRIL